MNRTLSTIAFDITADWKKVNYAATPYLVAMMSLDSIHDKYGFSDAKEIVIYFLANATTWRGPVARAIKAELNGMLKQK